MKDRYKEFISPSQSAYRQSRSTADILSTHRWVTPKTQEVDTKVHLTGIDMSSAFDTIHRQHLLITIKSSSDEDVYRMNIFLLSNKTLEIRSWGVALSSFTSNWESPQGDGISGILFNISLEDALRRARVKVIQNKPQILHLYSEEKVSLPEEMI